MGGMGTDAKRVPNFFGGQETDGKRVEDRREESPKICPRKTHSFPRFFDILSEHLFTIQSLAILRRALQFFCLH